MRCAKCQKIWHTAIVPSQIWDGTDINAIISFNYFIYFSLSSQHISLSPFATRLSLSSLVSISPLLSISFSLSFFYLSLSFSLLSLRLQQPSQPYSATFTQYSTVVERVSNFGIITEDPTWFISTRPRLGKNFGLLSLIRRKWLRRTWRRAKPRVADLSSFHTSLISLSLSLSLSWWLW